MFFIDLEPNLNNKIIYIIKQLLQCRIVFKAPKPKRDIPQCANCQWYGHTKKYCHRNSSVKCEECTIANCSWKERSDRVKYILYNGNHPANYKECAVFKELQKIKFPFLRLKKVLSAEVTKTQLNNNNRDKRNDKIPTYSEIVQRYTQTKLPLNHKLKY